MTRAEFEAIRDERGKRLVGPLVFERKRSTDPLCTARVALKPLKNGEKLQLNVSFNTRTKAKSFNISAEGTGPICRLDVDGPPHEGARCHKHSLHKESDPDRNLPTIVSRPDLAGLPLQQLWDLFKSMAGIIDNELVQFPDETVVPFSKSTPRSVQ